MPEPEIYARAAAALAAVLLLIWGAARLLRRTPLAAQPGRRLQVAETLALDARRRLVLARCDDREVLLLVGGVTDLQLGWLPVPGAPCGPSA